MGLLTVTLLDMVYQLTLVTWKRSSLSTSAREPSDCIAQPFIPSRASGKSFPGFARGGGCGPVDIVAWQTETSPSSHDLINF